MPHIQTSWRNIPSLRLKHTSCLWRSQTGFSRGRRGDQQVQRTIILTFNTAISSLTYCCDQITIRKERFHSVHSWRVQSIVLRILWQQNYEADGHTVSTVRRQRDVTVQFSVSIVFFSLECHPHDGVTHDERWAFPCQLTQSKHSQISPEVCLIGNQNGFFSLGIIMQIPRHKKKVTTSHLTFLPWREGVKGTAILTWKVTKSCPFHVTATYTVYGTYWWYSVSSWQLLCKHQRWQKAIKTYTGASHLFFPIRQKVSLLTGCQFPQAGHSLLKMLLINFHLYCSIDVPME